MSCVNPSTVSVMMSVAEVTSVVVADDILDDVFEEVVEDLEVFEVLLFEPDEDDLRML